MSINMSGKTAVGCVDVGHLGDFFIESEVLSNTTSNSYSLILDLISLKKGASHSLQNVGLAYISHIHFRPSSGYGQPLQTLLFS